MSAFETWADGRPGGTDQPPRAVGMHATQLRDVAMPCYTSAYTLWMVQRPLDAYRALPGPARAAVDRALAGSHCEEILAFAPRHRLGKRRFQLVFEGGAAA